MVAHALTLFLSFTGVAAASSYDDAVLADNPVLYLPMAGSKRRYAEPDQSGHGHLGKYYPPTATVSFARMPNGDRAAIFDGFSQYVEVASDEDLSVPHRGALTIEAWIRPDTLNFPEDESDGYVHWAGKGESGQQEYALRMYSYCNTASPSRANRISGYAFNLSGGLGSGSYFQDAVRVGEWIHVALVINARPTPGTISIFKNGVLRKATSLDQFGVTPRPGRAPLRIGSRDFGSYFQGAIGKFAIYPYALTEAQLKKHFGRMRRR